MMNKHTPGPWSNHQGYIYGPVVKEQLIADTFDFLHTNKVAARAAKGIDDLEGLANARLIAAAPDLLEACKSMLGILEVLDFSRQTTPVDYNTVPFKKWEQAIAKATK